MEVYRTLDAVDIVDEGVLNELIDGVSDGCEKVIVDGAGDYEEFVVYCVGKTTVKKYRLNIYEEEVVPEGEYRITERNDSRIVAGPVVIERVSKHSNVWRVNDSYFGDVSSNDNFWNYDGELVKWFKKKMLEILKILDDVGAAASFNFGTLGIDYNGIDEEVGYIEVAVQLCGRKIKFNVYSDGELIDGRVEIPLPDGSTMPVGILIDPEFWRGLKKLLCA